MHVTGKIWAQSEKLRFWPPTGSTHAKSKISISIDRGWFMGVTGKIWAESEQLTFWPPTRCTHPKSKIFISIDRGWFIDVTGKIWVQSEELRFWPPTGCTHPKVKIFISIDRGWFIDVTGKISAQSEEIWNGSISTDFGSLGALDYFFIFYRPHIRIPHNFLMKNDWSTSKFRMAHFLSDSAL